MGAKLEELSSAIALWRSHEISDYWISVSYLGSAVNRFGDHDLTFVDGQMWHRWDNAWRRIEQGSDFWLMFVPGTFALAREVIVRMQEKGEGDSRAIDVRYNTQYGYVGYLRVKFEQRDSMNFTYEVRGFGPSKHPEFTTMDGA